MTKNGTNLHERDDLAQLIRMRRHCGLAIYKSVSTLTSPLYSQLDPDIRDGYEKMAGIVFAELFKMDPAEVTKFFIDGKDDAKS